MFNELLDQKLCDPNKLDFEGKYTLLTYCHMNKKFKSFKKLLEKSDINPNQRNKDGTTTYGVLFYHSQTQFYIDEGYQPKENMEFLIQTCQKETFKNKININKTSIDILQSG